MGRYVKIFTHREDPVNFFQISFHSWVNSPILMSRSANYMETIGLLLEKEVLGGLNVVGRFFHIVWIFRSRSKSCRSTPNRQPGLFRVFKSEHPSSDHPETPQLKSIIRSKCR